MLLKDLMQDINLWSGIKSVEGFTFIVNPDLMDTRMVVDYGERTVYRAFEVLPEQQLFELIVDKFSSKWNEQVLIETDKINLMSDTTSSETKTGTSNKDVTRNDVVKNQVSGYNSTDLITEGGNDNNSTGNDSATYSDEILKGNYSISNLYNNLKDYQKTNILESTIKDVVQYLTLSIY
ncbi:hypothetical protein VPHK58G2_0004 [Vibrio phage K58 g2]